MKKLIFDACSIIYLTKIDMKELLPKLGTIMIGPIVKSEVIMEKDKFSDAKKIELNLDKGVIQEIITEIEDIPKIINLGEGEKETVELCLKENAILVTDDQQALNYAISRGLKIKTTETILLDFLQENIIDLKEFEIQFKKIALIKALKTDIIDFFMEKAQQISQNKMKIKKKEVD